MAKKVIIEGLILIRINDLYSQMTKTYKRISNFLLDNPSLIVDITLNQLSGKVDASEAAIIKYCKFLGLKGFTDLKIRLIKEVTIGLARPESLSIEGKDINSVSGYLSSKVINNIKNTFNSINYDDLEKVAKRILKSNRIILLATGTSMAVAYEFYSRMIRIGLNCICDFDYSNQRVLCVHAKKDDIVIAISSFGESYPVVESLKIAKENGSTAVCITSYIKSSITKYADIKLFTVSSESELKIEIPSKMAHMICLDVIYTRVALLQEEESIKALKKTGTTTVSYKSIYNRNSH